MATPCIHSLKHGVHLSKGNAVNNPANRPSIPLYSATEVTNWPPVSWLVDGVIQERSMAIIYGDSRVGKSFLALDLACKLGSGETWFGYRVKPCRVTFFAAESAAGLSARVQAIEEYNAKKIPDSVTFMKSNIDLCDQGDADKLLGTIDGVSDVLIIDTLNAASGITEENTSHGMGQVLATARRIVSQARCTVILIHHCGWSDRDHPRGHSSLAAAMDTRILVGRNAGHPNWRVKGQREGPDTMPHNYSLKVIDLSGNRGTSCVVEPLSSAPAEKVIPTPATGNQKIAFKVAIEELRERSPTPSLTTNDLAAMVAPRLPGNPKHQKQRAKEAIDALVRQGFLKINASGELSS